MDASVFGADPTKAAITVRHLLTMSSGLYGHGWWDIDELESRGTPVLEGALEAPLVAPPGWGFLYNNGASHVLSAVIAAAAGRPTDQVAADRLTDLWTSSAGRGQPTPRGTIGDAEAWS